MLRCPPSRISLTSTDLHDFEKRFNARQAARIPHLQQPNVRLSPGPGHQTKLATIAEDHNVGRRRAASSTSQATICSTEEDSSIDLPVTFVSNSSGVWAVDTPTNVQSTAADHTALCNEAATALEHAARQFKSPQKISSTSQAQQAVKDEPHQSRNDPTPAEYSLRFTGGTLDGCLEKRPAASPAHHRETDEDVPRSRRGLAVLGEIHADAFPTISPPCTVPPALSSARARRRNARSQDVIIAYDGPEVQHLIQARHVQRLPSRGGFHPDIPPPVPELVLPEGETNYQPAPNPALDPGAPVFVPRIRFGTMVSSSGDDDATVAAREPQWSTGHRVPSIVSAASGASSISSNDPSFTGTLSDAATEFLRMRNSPLDDLTERLSRLSASRPRSTGPVTDTVVVSNTGSRSGHHNFRASSDAWRRSSQ
ncbi:hypothetical protein LTR65_005612 [Meristemomyces frigidus]